MPDGAEPPSFDGGRRAVGVSGGGAGGVIRTVSGGVIRTERLRLAQVAGSDLAELFALHCDPRAFRDDLTAPLDSEEEMRWVLGQWRESWVRDGVGYRTVRARAAADALPTGLLGVVGLSVLVTDEGAALSAYWRLAPAATGRGIATEAMRAMLADPLHGPGGREVLAVTSGDNRASIALADRLGFRPAPPQRPVPGGRPGDVLLVRPGSPGTGR